MSINRAHVFHVVKNRNAEKYQSKDSDKEEGNEHYNESSGARLVSCFGGDHVSTVRALEVRYRLLSEGGCYHCWLRLHNSNLQTDRQTDRQTDTNEEMYAHTQTHSHTHTRADTHMDTYAWTHTHTDKHMHAQTQTLSLSLSLTHTHAHTHTQREREPLRRATEHYPEGVRHH